MIGEKEMKVKFQKMFDKHWLVFPISIMWNSELIEYVSPAKRLSIHFLWWHCAWTFIEEEKRSGQ
jgi:hypothetical protein